MCLTIKSATIPIFRNIPYSFNYGLFGIKSFSFNGDNKLTGLYRTYADYNITTNSNGIHIHADLCKQDIQLDYCCETPLGTSYKICEIPLITNLGIHFLSEHSNNRLTLQRIKNNIISSISSTVVEFLVFAKERDIQLMGINDTIATSVTIPNLFVFNSLIDQININNEDVRYIKENYEKKYEVIRKKLCV